MYREAIPAADEEVDAEQQAEQFVLFPQALTHEESGRMLASVLSSMGKSLETFSHESLVLCKTVYDSPKSPEVYTDEADEDFELLLGEYSELRKVGFTHEDITELYVAHKAGTLYEVLTSAVRKEMARTQQRLESSRERVEAADNEVRSYFSDLHVDYPREHNAATLFLGKYQNLVLATAQMERMHALWYEGACFAELDISIVLEEVNVDASAPLTDQELSLYIHERFHTLASPFIQKEATYVPFDNFGLRKRRIGFSLMSRSKRHHTAFNSIDEGATEFFTRQVCERLNYQEIQKRYYDNNVSSISEMLQVLKDEEDVPDEKQIEYLLRNYTSKSGLQRLKHALEEKIGPQGFACSEMFFQDPATYREFLALVEVMHAGALSQNDTLKITDDVFFRGPRISEQQFVKDYPFVRVYKKLTHRGSGKPILVPKRYPKQDASDK